MDCPLLLHSAQEGAITEESLIIPWMTTREDLKIASWRVRDDGRLVITVTGGSAEDRHAFEAQMIGGRTTVFHNGVVRHVVGPGQSGDDLKKAMTVIVSFERQD